MGTPYVTVSYVGPFFLESISDWYYADQPGLFHRIKQIHIYNSLSQNLDRLDQINRLGSLEEITIDIPVKSKKHEIALKQLSNFEVTKSDKRGHETRYLLARKNPFSY